jgi:8-oxo-dGDP phosphatase
VEVAPFYILEYPDWVHVLVLDETGGLILVRQYRHGFGDCTLELPGGAMDATERDPVHTARRELLDETGYSSDSMHLITSLSPNPSSHANRLHLVLARGIRLTSSPSPDRGEDIQVERVTVEAALALAFSGRMAHAQHVGLLLIGLKAAGISL